MLVDLYHTKAPLRAFVEYRLYRRRFSRAALPVEEDVVRRAPREEGVRVFCNDLFLLLVADDVRKSDFFKGSGRHYPAFVGIPAETAVKREFSAAALLVEFFRGRQKLGAAGGHGEVRCQRRDGRVFAFLRGRREIGEAAANIDAYLFFERAEVIIHICVQRVKVVRGEPQHRAAGDFPALVRKSEGVFPLREQAREPRAPDASRYAEPLGRRGHLFYAVAVASYALCGHFASSSGAFGFYQRRYSGEYFVALKVAVDDKLSGGGHSSASTLHLLPRH